MVVAERAAGAEARYRLLETIRQYALDRLNEAEEAEPAHRRHAEYFLSLAEQAEPRLMTRVVGLWMERLEAEHDNLRAALEWSEAEAGSAETMLRLAGALFWFWNRGSYLSEGLSWLTGALARNAIPSQPSASSFRGGRYLWGAVQYRRGSCDSALRY